MIPITIPLSAAVEVVVTVFSLGQLVIHGYQRVSGLLLGLND